MKNAPPKDAPAGNMIDRFAPRSWLPFMRLARFDRPIGIWLLFWPCLWGLAVAALYEGGSFPALELVALFALGSVVMRGAGCAVNDMADRDYDARNPRSRDRPLASGAMSLGAAALFALLLASLGAVILFQMNELTIALGVSSLILIGLYPFTKRIFSVPQLFLGFTFNWGALMGWTAESGALHPAALLLYLAAIFWTLGYDTIYALQDKESDALIGVKSSALFLGERVMMGVWIFYALALLFLLLTGWAADLGVVYYLCLCGAVAHGVWQARRVDEKDPDKALKIFRSNRECGALVALAFLAEGLARMIL